MLICFQSDISGIWKKIVKKIILKPSPARFRAICLGLNVLCETTIGYFLLRNNPGISGSVITHFLKMLLSIDIRLEHLIIIESYMVTIIQW